ncbi:MAG: TolC family protein [Magnetococcales bacterium]|nr:TolC family protein [Magnetococcales bacterium]
MYVLKEFERTSSVGKGVLWAFLVGSSFLLPQGAVAQDASGLNGQGFLEVSSQKRLKLSLKDFLHIARQRNEQILFQNLEKEIALASEANALSIFDPTVNIKLERESIRELNSAEEALARSSNDEYINKTNTFSAGVERLLPTGARASIDYSLEDIVSNLQTPSLSGDEVKSALGLTLTQPLLKGAGFKVVDANIRIAKEDVFIAKQTFRQTLTEVVFNAVQDYMDLQRAQEKLKTRKNSTLLADALLADNRRLFKLGLVSETEVLEAESGLAKRRSYEYTAQQEVDVAQNAMRQVLLLPATVNSLGLEAIDELEVAKPFKADATASLKQAFEKQPEYLSRKTRIQREGIRVEYAENQKKPQLDLTASFTMNGFGDGLDSSTDTAITEDYNTWKVGVEFTMPLGRQKSISEYKAAKHRQQQAKLDLKAIEVAITNNIDISTRLIENSYQQLLQTQKVAQNEATLLKTEQDRLKEGRSNSRQVLQRESALIVAREEALDKLVAYKKAILGIYLAEGSLLEKFGIEKPQETVDDKTDKDEPESTVSLNDNEIITDVPVMSEPSLPSIDNVSKLDEEKEPSKLIGAPQVTDKGGLEIDTSNKNTSQAIVVDSEKTINQEVVADQIPPTNNPEITVQKQIADEVSKPLVIDDKAMVAATTTLGSSDIAQLLEEAEQDILATRLTRGLNGYALEKYRRVLDQDPDNVRALRGLKYISDQITKLASENLRDMRLTRPKSGNALARYRKALEINPNNDAAKKGIMLIAQKLVYLAHKDLQELRLVSPFGQNALERFQIALSLDPSNPEAIQGQNMVKKRFLELGEMAIERKEWERAAGLLNNAIKFFPHETKFTDGLKTLQQRRDNGELSE